MVFYIVFYIAAFFLFYHLIDRIVKKNRQSKSNGKGSNDSRSRSAFTPRTVTYTTPGCETWPLFTDILEQPHTLIAGSTGSGKSVAMNGIISTVLNRLPFDQHRDDGKDGAQMILIDPKRVELARYKKMPHVIAYASGQNPEAWLDALKTAVEIMDERFDKMEKIDILDYNGGDLYVFIDEWASINSKTNPLRSECVSQLLRLVSEGRAAKVHVIMATQVPKANIIPTEIRDNFIARLALMTESKRQSRVIIDTDGCEEFPPPKIAGYANGLYCLPGNQRKVYTIPYVKQEEINSLINWWEDQMRQNGLNPRKAA